MLFLVIFRSQSSQKHNFTTYIETATVITVLNKFHHYLRSKTVLEPQRLMIPKPPNSLCLQTRFQFTKQKSFPSLWVPFQS